MDTARSSSQAVLALAGRVLMAAVFIAGAIGKLDTPAATVRYIASAGLPAPLVGFVGSMLLELSCGLLLIFGYRTRTAAAALAAYCVITALLFHHSFVDHNQAIHFMKNLAMAGGLLAFAGNGAGAFSIDHLLSHSSARSAYARYPAAR